jgi:hypothetical protein
MKEMGSRSATELLLLPVQLHGIRLGRPVDLLLDVDTSRALGFVVLCGDDTLRFLVFATADLREDEIGLPSALLLLEDVEFYRGRSRSLRALLGGEVVDGERPLGELRDLLLAPDGTVAALLVHDRDGISEVDPGRATAASGHVSTT